MAARGSALQRALTYFREAQIDEARVAYQLAEEIMTKRLDDAEKDFAPFKAKASTPRKQRKTRTPKTGATTDHQDVQAPPAQEHRESLADA